MSASVLLDTGFLISLVNAKRAHHTAAQQYYRHMLQNNIPMYFSAIVAAEFGIKQPITDLPLNNFRTQLQCAARPESRRSVECSWSAR